MSTRKHRRRPCGRKQLDPQPCSLLPLKRGLWYAELRARAQFQKVQAGPQQDAGEAQRLDSRDPIEYPEEARQ